MFGIKYFPEKLNVEGKKIIIRLDLNVPFKNKEIQDSTRIDIVLPFLEKLIKKKAKIIVVSHLGRPSGERDNKLSLLPICKFLKKKISSNIYFFVGEIDNQTKNKTAYLKPGEIILFDKFSIKSKLNDLE